MNSNIYNINNLPSDDFRNPRGCGEFIVIAIVLIICCLLTFKLI